MLIYIIVSLPQCNKGEIKMHYNYVTIERLYGSQGTKIGLELAKQLNWPCYGQKILTKVSNDYNIPEEKIQKYEESVTNSFLYSMFVLSQVRSGNTEMLSAESHIYMLEQKAIQELASKGPAIFLGHCASEALANRQGVLRVFIYGNKQDRIKHIHQDYGVPFEDVNDIMHYFDKKRANYYYANTTRKWNDPENYDLILNSSDLKVNNCVKAIAGIIDKNKG